MRAPLTIRAGLVVGAMSLLSLAGCDKSASACDVPIREELDPNSLLHVTDPSAAVYKTDPPTSGPHMAASAPGGLVRSPMKPAVQVTILERGDVLVQYRDSGDLAALQGLVGTRVVVAPQPSLPARVVVTAWTYKLVCKSVDTDAITKFAEAHAGKAQEH